MDIRRCALLGCLLLAAQAAGAEWSGKGELGGVLARGNTETETLSGRLDVGFARGEWEHRAGTSVLRTVSDGVKTANRWELRAESDRNLDERRFLFGSLRYLDDEFTDYSYQASAAAGYGYRFITGDRHRLTGRIGAGYRRSELEASGLARNEAILRGALDWERQLTDTTLIADRLLVEAGSDNTYIQNELSLEVRINSALALGLGYAVRHNTDVQPGTENTDQVLTANLVFSF